MSKVANSPEKADCIVILWWNFNSDFLTSGARLVVYFIAITDLEKKFGDVDSKKLSFSAQLLTCFGNGEWVAAAAVLGGVEFKVPEDELFLTVYWTRYTSDECVCKRYLFT
jgi:hypothetical protein